MPARKRQIDPNACSCCGARIRLDSGIPRCPICGSTPIPVIGWQYDRYDTREHDRARASIALTDENVRPVLTVEPEPDKELCYADKTT